MKFMHTGNFGNFLSLFNRAIANRAIVINVVGQIRYQADLVGFGILFVK
jgi:hypothetical protein